MAKEPWQEDIYENQEEQTRTERRQRNQKGTGVVANRVLTILASLFFVMAVILFLGGIQLLTIGILGKYISKIYLETKKRPLYLIKEKSDLPDFTEKNKVKRL